MIDSYQVDFRPDKYIITNRNTTSSEKRAALLDETSLPNIDGFTIINVEWRQNGGGCIQFFVKNTFHIFMHLFMRTITRVHLGRSLYGSENVRNQFIITRFIRWDHLTAQVFCKNIVHHLIVLIVYSYYYCLLIIYYFRFFLKKSSNLSKGIVRS